LVLLKAGGVAVEGGGPTLGTLQPRGNQLLGLGDLALLGELGVRLLQLAQPAQRLVELAEALVAVGDAVGGPVAVAGPLRQLEDHLVAAQRLLVAARVAVRLGAEEAVEAVEPAAGVLQVELL